MKKFSEQLHKKSTSVKLQKSEKIELRERLVSYMEYHPLPAELQGQKVSKKKTAPKAMPFTESYTNVSIPFFKIFKASAVMAVLVLIVLPFAAERAVPGDTLYAIKVEFNEELRSTLIFDSFQKVEWETERLNRRIAEARLLESEGRLTEEVGAEVAEAVRTHTDNVKREIEVLRGEDADEAAIASISLDTTLAVQSKSLKGEGSDPVTGLPGTEGSVSVNLITEAIDQSIVQVEDYNASSILPAYDKLMARVERNTTRIYELIGAVSKVAPEEHLAEITRRLEDIERSILEAIELSEVDTKGAQLQLVDVLQRTQKLIVYITDIEVTETVDIETLVPVVLTDVEEEAAVTSLTEELKLGVARVNELYALVEDEQILEKIDVTLVEVAVLSDIMASSSVNLPAFQSVADEALILTNDMIVLLERHLAPVEIFIEESEDTASTTDIVGDIEDDEQATSTEEAIVPEDTNASSTSTTTDESVDLETEATSTVDSI